MNQEQKNVVSTTTTANTNANTNTNTNTNTNNILPGSPGIVIAPVNEAPVDASSRDKNSVVGGIPMISSNVVTVPSPSNVAPTTVTPPATPASPPPAVPPVVTPPVAQPAPRPKKSRKALFFIILLLLVIAGLGYYIYTDYMRDQARGECSPLVASDTSLRELDINSSIVQELYDKVKTSVREDLAYHNFDDTFKLYLALRQIPQSDMYDSNCNLYNENAMSNFLCQSATDFTPNAFKEETLQREVRKLFGESIEIPNQNIVLGNSCFGGYQYIADRGEYVEGYCGSVPTTSYNVDKELISATVQGDTIILRENVRYYSAEGITGSQLQNGVYVHTFRLDNHYHYAYVDRTIEEA